MPPRVILESTNASNLDDYYDISQMILRFLHHAGLVSANGQTLWFLEHRLRKPGRKPRNESTAYQDSESTERNLDTIMRWSESVESNLNAVAQW
ncbi:hypothetical protein SVAN01_02800 [Stagonosporopsis vannaccii]|nr:hypothetical protein SVAN01_02800 [Stagonosporopsis vannaccii]